MIRKFCILLFSQILFIQGCELENSSEQLTVADLIGKYIPNHNGLEALQIRSDYVWIRSYIDTEKRSYLDSGLWQFEAKFDNQYELILDQFFYRHKPWVAKYVLNEPSYTLRDSISQPKMCETNVYKKKSRIRLIIPINYPSLYYEKVSVENRN